MRMAGEIINKVPGASGIALVVGTAVAAPLPNDVFASRHGSEAFSWEVNQ